MESSNVFKIELITEVLSSIWNRKIYGSLLVCLESSYLQSTDDLIFDNINWSYIRQHKYVGNTISRKSIYKVATEKLKDLKKS